MRRLPAIGGKKQDGWKKRDSKVENSPRYKSRWTQVNTWGLSKNNLLSPVIMHLTLATGWVLSIFPPDMFSKSFQFALWPRKLALGTSYKLLALWLPLGPAKGDMDLMPAYSSPCHLRLTASSYQRPQPGQAALSCSCCQPAGCFPVLCWSPLTDFLLKNSPFIRLSPITPSECAICVLPRPNKSHGHMFLDEASQGTQSPHTHPFSQTLK